MSNKALTELAVKLSTDIGDLKRDMAVVRSELRRTQSEANRNAPIFSSWNKSIGSVRSSLVGLRSSLLGFAGVSATAFSAHEAIQLADAYTSLQAKLGLVTSSEQQRARVQSELFNMSQNNRTSLEGSVGLYVRLAQSSAALRNNEDLLLSTVDRVSKSLVISGASASESASAQQQFSQALAAGKLRGDEFRSVMENAPRLAKALATGLSVPTGALYEMAEAGELTADRVIRAIESQGDVIDEEFSKIPVTVSGAWQQFKNATLQAVGVADQASGSTRGIASAISDMAATMNSAETRQSIGNLIKLLVDLSKAAVTAMNYVNRAIGRANGAYQLSRLKNGGDAIFEGVSTDEEIRTRRAIAQAGARTLREPGYHTSGLINTINSNTAGLNQITSDRAKWAAGNQDVIDARNIAAWKRGYVAPPKAPTISSGSSGKANATKGSGSGGAGRSGRTARGDSPAAILAATADATELATDQIKRSLESLEGQYKSGALGIADYFGQKLKLQKESLDLQIAEAGAEMRGAKTVEARSRAMTQLAKLMRDRSDLEQQAKEDAEAANKELTHSYEEVAKKVGEANVDAVAVTRAELEKQYGELIAKLNLNGRTVEAALVGRYIDSTSKIAGVQAASERADTIGSGLSTREGSLSSQIAAGTLSTAEGERQILAARRQAIAQLKELRAAQLAALASMAPGSSEHTKALEGIEKLEEQIADVTASTKTLRNEMKDQAINDLNNFFSVLRTGAMTGKEALLDMVGSFLDALAAAFQNKVSTAIVEAVFGLLTPKAQPAEVHHGGGIAGNGARFRSMFNPMLFGEAPRFHSGGFPGLSPTEVAAVLQKGEEVLTRDDPRHRANGGGVRVVSAAPASAPIVNVINNTGQPTQQRQVQGSGGVNVTEIIVGEVARDIAGDGRIAKTMQTVFGVQRRGVARGS